MRARGLQAGESCKAVRLQARATDQVLRLDRLAVGRTSRDAGGGRRDARDRAAEPDLAAERAHVVGQRTRHAAIVDHRRLGCVQRADADRVGLDLGDLPAVELAEAANPVRCGATAELREALELRLVDGDDQLPAVIDRDSLLRRVPLHRLLAPDAERCFQRAGRVVDAAVQDPGVVAGLVEADLPLLVDHQHAQRRTRQQEGPCRREADDSGTHDEDVVTAIHA